MKAFAMFINRYERWAGAIRILCLSMSYIISLEMPGLLRSRVLYTLSYRSQQIQRRRLRNDIIILFANVGLCGAAINISIN